MKYLYTAHVKLYSREYKTFVIAETALDAISKARVKALQYSGLPTCNEAEVKIVDRVPVTTSNEMLDGWSRDMR